MRPGELSRRALLGLSLGAAGTVVFGCSSDHDAVATNGAAAGAAAPFGIWEQLRTAVRASPDHLSATADRLVAAKDPIALFEFVRDQIIAYPPIALGGAVNEVRWGVRGTLRGGAGTPREKAELLAALYQRAGFDASVVVGNATDSDPDNRPAQRAFLRPIKREVAPAVDTATLSAWKKRMAAVGQVPEQVAIDPDDSERTGLVAAIAPLLPPDIAAQIGAYDATLDTVALSDVPLVSVKVDGKTRYANPLFGEAKFGDSLTDERPLPAPDMDAAPEVVVELFVSTTAAPTKRISVARSTYPADTLAGRQVLVQFAPATDLATLSTLRISDIHSFKPVISLRGQDVDPNLDPSFVVVGPQVTVRGDIVETADDGSVSVNGRLLFQASDLKPKAAAKVAAVSVEVRAGGFPFVNLVVAALDSAGNAVKGLPAAAFSVLEGAAPMGFLERATPSDAVRVYLAFDLDDPLASGEDPLDFAQQLTTAVLAAYPGASIVTGLEGMYVEQTDPLAVAAAVAGGDSDDTWADLANAAGATPTLVVVVSDFIGLVDAADPANFKGAYQAIVAGGPPVVAISTAPTDSPPLPEVDKLVALTGGVSVPAGGVADSVQAVLELLAKQLSGQTYTLTYKAPVSGPARRNVQLTVNEIAAKGSYTAPSTNVDSTALAGVYLSVSIGEDSVTRVLGGYRGQNPPDVGVSVPQAVLDDVTNALFAVNVLSFEAAAPSLSQSLDDLLSIKLAIQPLWEAVAAKDSAKTQASLPALRTYVPKELTELQCPLPPATEASATYETRLRVVLYSHRPQFGVGHEKRVDVLALGGVEGGWGSISADAKVSFQDTLARSARAAIVEGHTFPTSTLSKLAGKELILLPIGGVDPASVPWSDEVFAAVSNVLSEYDEWHRLIANDPEFLGFWAVSPKTGMLLGVLPDGSGGAASSAECNQLNATNKAFDALGVIAEVAGLGGLGPFFFLGKQVAAIYLLSAAILDGQEVAPTGDHPNPAIDGLAANAACEAAKLAGTTVAGAYGGFVGDVIGKTDAIGSLADAVPNCPNALAGVGCSN